MKQIIMLEKAPGGALDINYVLWVAVPAARQFLWASPDNTSAYKDASAAELAALVDGSVAERNGRISMPEGTTNADLRSALIDLWNEFSDEVTGGNTLGRYGTNWDGTSWTQGGL